MRMYKVYRHTNKINGKKYIGITCRDLIQRWGKYGQRYSTNEHFWNAIKKYGWDNFSHDLLLHDLTPQQASSWEVKLISYYRTLDPDYGYNKDKGGIRGVDLLYSDDVIIKLSDFSLYSSVMQCAIENNISDSELMNACCSELNCGMKREYMWLDEFNDLSKEDKEIAIYGKVFDNSVFKETDVVTNRDYVYVSKACSVICLENKQIYESLDKAAKDNHVSRNTIIAHCDGDIRYNIKRKFMYLDEYHQLTDEEKQNAQSFNSSYQRGVVKVVIRLSDWYIFLSENECIVNDTVTPYTLLRHCRGVVRGNLERKYMYLEDFIKLSLKERERLSFRYLQQQELAYVTLVDGKSYPTIRAWKAATNGKQRTLLKHCDGKLYNPDDRLYMYKSEYDLLSESEKELWKEKAKIALSKLVRTSGLPTPVVRLSDGKVFDTVKKAAKACHRSERMVSDHCHGKATKDRINFMFLSDYESISEEDKLFYKSRDGVEQIVTKNKVIDLSTGEIYISLKDCYKHVNVGEKLISEHCKGKREFCRFMFLYDYDCLSEEDKCRLSETAVDMVQHPEKYRLKNKAVIRLSDKQIFYSIKDCVEQTGLSLEMIIDSCKGRTKIQEYMYLSDYKKYNKVKENNK